MSQTADSCTKEIFQTSLGSEVRVGKTHNSPEPDFGIFNISDTSDGGGSNSVSGFASAANCIFNRPVSCNRNGYWLCNISVYQKTYHSYQAGCMRIYKGKSSCRNKSHR